MRIYKIWMIFLPSLDDKNFEDEKMCYCVRKEKADHHSTQNIKNGH